MTTYGIWYAQPAAGSNSVGYAAPCDSGLRLDDSITGTGTNKSLIDIATLDKSTAALRVGSVLQNIFQKHDRSGRQWMATSDAGATFIKATQ
jgi:hypothetical protein